VQPARDVQRTATPILAVRGMPRRFKTGRTETLALQAIDLDVTENDFSTILGPALQQVRRIGEPGLRGGI